MNMSNGNINIKLPAVNRGFSLVELMVALVITLILLAGIGQIFLSSKKSFTIQNALGRQQENGRYVLDTLAQDLRRAGYLGGALKIEKTGWSLAVVTGADSCAGNTDWGTMLDRPIFGLDDDATGYACVKSYLQGDVLVVRYDAPWELGGVTTPMPAAGNWPNRLYMRSNPTNPKTARIFQGEPPAQEANDRDAELIAYAYYIGNSSQTCSNDGSAIPSLFRVGLDDSGKPASPEEIASGIEQLQVQYGVDTNGDLSVDQYLDADALATTNDWNQVIAARVWVLTRAECPETGYTNTNTYDMGDVNYPAKPDRYRRQLYQTTVKLRNRIGAS
jgi:type IV pilus assembly protein PilW